MKNNKDEKPIEVVKSKLENVSDEQLSNKLKATMNEMRESGHLPTLIDSRRTMPRVDAERLFHGAFKSIVGTNYKPLPEYEQIIDWLADNDGKGLAIFGSKGTGKSITVMEVIPMVFRLWHNKFVSGINPTDIMRMDKNDVSNFLKKQTMIIDEVGRENMAADFGTKFEFVYYALDEADSTKRILIFSSNLTNAEFINRYGEAGWDRVKGNCKIVIFDSESFRE